MIEIVEINDKMTLRQNIEQMVIRVQFKLGQHRIIRLRQRTRCRQRNHSHNQSLIDGARDALYAIGTVLKRIR